MSVIQTIRNKYGKIAGGLIALALIGFIISDANNGSFGNFFRGNDNTVLKVNGDKVDPKEYQEHVKEYETLYSMFNKNNPLDDATRSQMNEQVIQMIIYEKLVNEQCDKLGIMVSAKEIEDMTYGENADPIVRQFQFGGQQIFVNQQTGQFDPGAIKQFEKAMADDPSQDPSGGKLIEQWQTVKAYVKRMARVNKYNSMFAGAVYVPSFMAKKHVNEQNSQASIRYVKVPYSVIADNDVKVTDDEIKAYMQKHAAQYETEQETRTIEYISYDIVPAVADTARQVDMLQEIKGDFAAAKDNKTFVNSKSDETNAFNEAYMNKRTFMSRYADTIMSLPVGEVFGPYYESGTYRITKVIDRKTLPDSVNLKHILVFTKTQGQDVRGDSAAKSRLDSAIALIKGGAKFDSVAAIYSDDGGSKDKGGEYWFTLQQRPTISKEFGDFVFEGKTGEEKTVSVKNDNYSGYHYIVILDQKGTAPAVQLGTVAKILAPSDSTDKAIYATANEFAGKNTTAALFDEAVKKQNLDKRIGDNIKENSFSITGLGSAREIVRWAYKGNIGDISQVFQLGDQRYVVAKIAGTNPKGIPAITAANRPMLEMKVKDEKKAEAIIKKFGSAGSLDGIATASGQAVQQADTVTLGAAYVNGLGYEPKVVGYAFNAGFQPNAVSPGIKGQGGVYFITVLTRNIGNVDASLMNAIMPQQRMQLEGQLRNSITQSLQQNMTKKADVEYNTDNF
ncbi:MAG: peptidyl-prolyl cis-trans isomerase [Flavipsychrobacter sp.]|jgi:peptidyl-prolyl cis-trans isomerase D|nr:peptidyl-prolyl cis-trans isomerase [Flavipsychrobacter sp.]